MSDTFNQALNGDISAFAELYAENYKDMYHVAYHSLANVSEATDAVKFAARDAYGDIRRCSSKDEFKLLMVKKLCDRIIGRFKEYRKNTPQYEVNSPYIKAQMKKLTDAERFSVALWAVYGINAKEIAKLSGLAEDVVSVKLKSGQAKLEPKL